MQVTDEQNAALSAEEFQRYSRHLTLPDFGQEGQEKLKAASVLLVGAGGLGSPAAMYLAAAGVGRIGLVDFDNVEASNLQRQVLYGTSDVGQPKLDAAKTRLEDLNPHVTIDTHELRLTSDNALAVIDDYDVVADGTDNFPTRYLVNDACVMTGTPNVSTRSRPHRASCRHARRGVCLVSYPAWWARCKRQRSSNC